MSVLSAQTIRRRDNMEAIIRPFEERTEFDGLTYGLGPAGYDIRIGNFEPNPQSYKAKDLLIEESECEIESYYNLYPGFHLLSTLEHICIPNDIQAIVHDKSTWARRGVAVQNTVIDPGFRGFITLEITNHSHELWTLKKGTPIAQLVFHQLDYETEIPYTGKYQDQQSGPQGAR